MCTKEGKVVGATIADHITPHKGDVRLFWEGPLQSLCKPHHDKTKSYEEKRGVQIIDEEGWPVPGGRP